MTLTYRGIPYPEKQAKTPTPAVTRQKNIIYRGNSPQARINAKFPWWKYLKQIFKNSQSQAIFDPITFWYHHKRQFLDDVWRSHDAEKLDRCWDLTLQIERSQAVKSKQPIKLKYRGVTYYR